MWRYSRVDELDLERYTPAGSADVADQGIPAPLAELLAEVPERAGLVVVVDGRLVHVELGGRWIDRGVGVGALADAAVGPEVFGAVSGDATDVFGMLNEALTVAPVLIDVPAGVAVDGPIVVAQWTSASRSLVASRLVVRTGQDAEVRVLDIQASPDGIDALVLPLVELDVAASSRLGYANLQVLGDRTWQVARQASRVGGQATLRSFTGAFGGEYARLRTDCRLEGRGASGDLLAAYFGSGAQTLDFRTFQDHAAPDTTSDLLFKGAVDDESRSVYTGLIQVRPDAKGTNAVQTNRNVKLSPDAWAESVPNLQIENNDVRCAHASTVGPIDEDQLFYLESRGVPTDVAERLVVGGFFDEVIEQVPVRAAEPTLRRLVAESLAAGAER